MKSRTLFDLPYFLGLSLQIGIEDTFQFKTIFVPLSSDGTLRPNDVAHELGHFLVAPKSRRYRKDYGIPAQARGADRARWDMDESKARMVEHFLLARFGYSFKKDPLRLADSHYQAKEVRRWWRTEGKLSVIVQLAGFR